jgi:hypothetical protein
MHAPAGTLPLGRFQEGPSSDLKVATPTSSGSLNSRSGDQGVVFIVEPVPLDQRHVLLIHY